MTKKKTAKPHGSTMRWLEAVGGQSPEVIASAPLGAQKQA
jgi:hypothetical protein